MKFGQLIYVKREIFLLKNHAENELGRLVQTFFVFQKSFIYPVDTGRKLNVHKTFRRRPGRLLNVLCTFNLHPVSTR